MWLDIRVDKNGISIFKIFIGKKYIIVKRKISLPTIFKWFYIYSRSSKKPTKNTE